jgi:predicted hotdog family 3-hydroxylacyl-ACP dehydratase
LKASFAFTPISGLIITISGKHALKMNADILERLPHRPPFVMIDSIERQVDCAIGRFRIEAENVLVEDGFFSESGLVEHMAQTAGAGLPQPEGGSAPSVGYIGALKDLKIEQLPSVGETIITEVSFLHQVMNAHIVQAQVRNEAGDLLASCELKIFLQS